MIQRSDAYKVIRKEIAPGGIPAMDTCARTGIGRLQLPRLII